MFKVYHYNDNLEIEALNVFDIYEEAKAYVLKLGDRNILARIGVDFQEENPIYA